jgi:hypothetical protein
MRRDFTPAWGICLLLSLKPPTPPSPEVDFPPCPVKWFTPLRLVRSSQSHQAFQFHLVHLVPCVRITAGTGLTDLHAMPGSVHHTCVLRLQGFPLLLLFISERLEPTLKEPVLLWMSFSSELITRADTPWLLLSFSMISFSFLIACLLTARCVSRGKSHTQVESAVYSRGA